MAKVHDVIHREGIENARRGALTTQDRLAVETAYQVLSAEQGQTGFAYFGFALISLPHKRQEEPVWRREGHNITMLLQSGVDHAGRLVGVPYGSYARFILLFLQSRAVRSTSREIELGRSMQEWLGRMGLSSGGKSYKLLKEQSKRVSLCRLTFYGMCDDVLVMRNGTFIEGATLLQDGSDSSAWKDHVRLDEAFFRALSDNPVPISEAALRAIGPRSMALDVYVWLAYRLHVLEHDVRVNWSALQAQFGSGYTRERAFRAQFRDSFSLALAAYPEARVSLDEEGVVLRPSRPAITGSRVG